MTRIKTLQSIAAGLLLLLPLTACSPGEDDAAIAPVDDSALTETETPSPSVAVAPESTLEGSVSGEVTRVDEILGTFSLTDSNNTEWEFRFSDTTAITGESAAQGLTGTEGSSVVVYYEGDPGARRAVRIEILGDPAPDTSILP